MGHKITCRRCQGSGEETLNGITDDTLAILRKHPGSTGASLAVIAGCKATAMNMRLAALERFGLATSERYGRERRFKVKR